jgi:heme exporter protein CcmD
MSHDPHLGFVVAAYALAFVIVAAMTVTILADYMRLKQALSSLSRATRQDPDSESFE